MKFRTEYRAAASTLRLDPRRPIALIGSCFAQNMAQKMEECGWEVFCGGGTLYNPLSIAKVLSLLLFDEDWEETFSRSLFEADGVVHSWLFDSHFSCPGASECVENVKETRDALLRVLDDAQALIVTFGTSWCYFLESEPDCVVANCHKQHPDTFERRRISPSIICDVWCRLLNELRLRFPNLTVILTVSPVRHLKDGFEGNSRSKAALLLAVEDICGKNTDTLYFPAYEILCDDLRDYRFYASDLVHPSQSAIEYIWEKFCLTFIDESGEQILKDGKKERLRRLHRPIIGGRTEIDG